MVNFSVITKTLLSCTWPPRWPPTRWPAPSPEWSSGGSSCPSTAAPRMPANTCQKVQSLFFCLYHIRWYGNIQISSICKVFLISLLGNHNYRLFCQAAAPKKRSSIGWLYFSRWLPNRGGRGPCLWHGDPHRELLPHHRDSWKVVTHVALTYYHNFKPVYIKNSKLTLEGYFQSRWKLQDDNGDDFICFEIPMKIEAWESSFRLRPEFQGGFKPKF